MSCMPVQYYVTLLLVSGLEVFVCDIEIRCGGCLLMNHDYANTSIAHFKCCRVLCMSGLLAYYQVL